MAKNNNDNDYLHFRLFLHGMLSLATAKYEIKRFDSLEKFYRFDARIIYPTRTNARGAVKYS